jgi:hypothetical protein
LQFRPKTGTVYVVNEGPNDVAPLLLT